MMAYGSLPYECVIGLLSNPVDRYANIEIGEPPQKVEMDLNMLASDFYIVITTSRKGSRYDDLFSQTGGKLHSNMKPETFGSHSMGS